MEIGAKIRFFRLLNCMTQQALCATVGIQAPYLARYESGTNEPRKEMVPRFAQALNVNLEWLVYATRSPFDLDVVEPIVRETSVRHGNTIIAGLTTLFPEFLKEIEINSVRRVPLADSAIYMLAFHYLSPQRRPVQDCSMLIIQSAPAVQEIIDSSLQGRDISAQEMSIGQVDFDFSTANQPEAEGFLRKILVAANIEWLDIDKCLSSWRNSHKQDLRTSWSLQVSVEVTAQQEITREDALEELSKALEGSRTLSKGVTLKLHRRGTDK